MKSVKVYLLDNRNDVQYGLNWGKRENRDPNQSYLQLDPVVYKSDFFPPKGKYFVVKTDDGETMIFTRAQKELGCALQTPENNAMLGLYIRKRLGVSDGEEILKSDIENAPYNYFEIFKVDDMNYLLKFGSEELSGFEQNVYPHQVIYYGAPGTGKSHTIDSIVEDSNSVRTTFHPDSDYASFVGAYKPTMERVAMSAFVGKEVHKAIPQNGHSGTEQKIVYKYVPQAFLKAYVEAWRIYDPANHKPFYLVIEEINRGNCAQIFGDLFQLLDRNNQGASSYPINADEDIQQFLASDKKGFAAFDDEQKEKIRRFRLCKDSGAEEAIGEQILNGSKLLFPPNLYIWATMNTSDQSLFPIDSAFKRRWDWKYMPIEYDKADWLIEVGENLYRWGDFLRKINPEIYALTESSDKQMGYFFAKADPQTGIIPEDIFLNKVLFYLWTDVFKDYDVESDVFRNTKENRSFRFTDFFEDKDALNNFIANLNLEVVDVEPQNATEEAAVGRRRKYQSLNVKFSDGTQIQEDTIVGTFLKALEMIGIDKVAEAVESIIKYRRHGYPIVTKQPVEVLIENDYHYTQVGEYYVVNDVKKVTMSGLLRQISDKLNLGLTIALE